MKVSCLYFSIVLFSLSAHAGEVLFANYFDIKVKQPEGISVIGKIHLKRNKDVDRSAIPGDYTFEITNYKSGTFIIKTKFDEKRRIFGVFEVAPGKNTGSIPADQIGRAHV